MRKIKANKKDVEKKQKKIAKLMEELVHWHSQVHDEQKVLETVKAIAELEPDDPAPAEKVASIYVDYNKAAEADKAVTYLEKHFPPTPYRLFLRSRVQDLKADYGGCVEYSLKALEFPNVELLTRMMIYNILGHAYRYAGDAPNSLKYYELSAKIDPTGAKDPNTRVYVDRIKREDYSNFLFSIHNVNASREKIFEEICGFDKIYGNVEMIVHSRETHPHHEKLRIGYISPDIRHHVVAFFSYAFYKCYDKSRFEVYIYAKNKEDRVAEDFKNSVDGFRNILFDNPQQAIKKIMDDEIDILVDLAGHTANNVMDILVYKPAPVMISAIGWFNTTGVKAIDYFMVDKYTDPEGFNDAYFSEKMLRLQHSHFCYMWHDNPTVVNPAPCTKNGYVTFVSFNNFTKVTDETLRVWAKIVNAVPNAKLYLKGKAFRDQYGTDAALKRIEAAGISVDKLIYEPDEREYLHKYSRADIALDTFPYPGGGTTCDALYMGLPVITLVQERHNSRFGFSLLNNCGLGELCAFSEEEYIQKAVELANDWDRIREYHLTIRRKLEESPVMNDTVYMGEVEDAYIKIFNAWRNGEELPEFPQDPPPVTNEQGDFYLNRAKNYLNMEPDFNKGKVQNVINIKRALYSFELAAKSDKFAYEPEVLYSIASCKKYLKDYGGAYDAICATGRAIYEHGRNIEEFSKGFLSNYHKLQAQLEMLIGTPVSAVDNFEKAVNFAPDFRDKCSLASAGISCLNYLYMPSEKLAAAHFQFQKLVQNVNVFSDHRKPEGRIKIGYVSSNFCKSEMFTLTFGVIASHNKNKFEVTCYNLTDNHDIYTGLYEKSAEHFVDIRNLSYSEIAQKIRDDKIDVLVDLNGHNEGNILPVFACKPATIQVSGIGYTFTTGLKAMDFFITDEIVDPPGAHEKFFSERLLYFPSQYCYALREDVPAPQYAPATKRDYAVFGVMCSWKDINNDMLKIWKQILERVPKSVLVIRANEFISNSLIDRAYDKMKKLGFNMDQILFRRLEDKYMEEMLQVDVMLDTYPCGGRSTVFDALYMGVPVVTLYGERRGTRAAASILKQLGMEGLAVPINTIPEYIERAVGLVSDLGALDALHKNLRTMLQKAPNIRTHPYTGMFEGIIQKLLNEKFNATASTNA